MGNVCGKSEVSTEDRIAHPRRSITSTNPKKTSHKNVVGGGVSHTLQSGPVHTVGSTVTGGDRKDAKQKAAEAAEARAAASNQKQKGKLASQLQKQKKQSRAAVLDGTSRDTLKIWALDENREAQKHQ